MGTLVQSALAGVVVLLTTLVPVAQDLPPALAARFADAVAALKQGHAADAETIFRDILQRGGDAAPVHHNLGIVLQQRGRHEEAIAEFRAASRLDPAYGPARLLAGTSLIALDRLREARTELTSAVRLMPREIAAHLQLADVCQRLDDRLCVTKAYHAIAQLAPDDPEYAYRLGSAHLELSEWSYDRLAKVAPNSARVHQALGREYLQQRQTERAVSEFQRALEADPTLPDLHLALARIHLEEGRVEEAAREVSRELAIVPFSKEALELQRRITADGSSPRSLRDKDHKDDEPGAVSRDPQIDAAIRERRWTDAERLLAEAIDRDPRSRDLLVLIARVFVLDGKPLNAAVALKKADAIAPLDADLRFALVLAYVRLGRADWARPELDRLVEANPDNAEYRYWIGRLAYDAGKYAEAIARFDEALARDPQFMRAHDNLGLCYEALDDPEKAIVHYREAIRLNRQARAKSPWPPTNLAILLRQRGEATEAAALFEEALQYDAGFAKGHYELGILLDQQGKIADAVRELERAAALDRTYAEPHYLLSRLYRRQGQNARADEALATFLRLRAAREQGSK